MDVHTVAVGTLRKNVNSTLNSDSFVRILRANEIILSKFSAPKQTPITQRWKLQIRASDSVQEIPTKIEFSRRSFDLDSVLAPVDPEITSRYALYPVMVQHYLPATAALQKIQALALRTETQARDVFDLNLLFESKAKPLLDPANRKLLAMAVEKAIGISFDEFAGQVVAYLEPEHQEFYRSKKAWDNLQERVVDKLRQLAA